LSPFCLTNGSAKLVMKFVTAALISAWPTFLRSSRAFGSRTLIGVFGK
jgi:hypothetical protein